MKSKYLIPEFLITCLLLYASAFALKEETTQGKVMQVKDGDTIVVSPVDGGQFVICRLYGIDAPEATKQPYGDESTKELKRLILGQEVAVEIRERDKYGRGREGRLSMVDLTNKKVHWVNTGGSDHGTYSVNELIIAPARL